MAKGNFAPDRGLGRRPVRRGLRARACCWSLALPALGDLRAVCDPESLPAPRWCTDAAKRASLLRDVLVSVLPTLALIIAVLGSILGGIATPTESASVGAVGAMLLAAARGRFSFG